MTLFSLSLNFFLNFFSSSSPSFSLFFCSPPARLNSLSGVFFPGRAGIKAPRSRSAYCGADTRSPWAGARRRQRVRGHPWAAPLGFSPSQEPFLQGFGAGVSLLFCVLLFGFFYLFLPTWGDFFPVVSSRLSLLWVLRRGRKQREGAPPHPPTPNPPCPAAAPLFACHVYNLVETKTDIVVRRR